VTRVTDQAVELAGTKAIAPPQSEARTRSRNGLGSSGGGARAARWQASAQTFDVSVFVPSGGPLGQPWYLTFGKTNPSTLNYEP
jgi:hypothetical protein